MSNRRVQSLTPHIIESGKPKRGRCITAICFSWKILTCIVSHVTLVLLVVSYCVGGAYLFQHLEKPHELEVKKGIHYMRLNLTEKIWRLSDNVSVLNENDWISDVKKDLANFEKQILTAMKSDGWDGDEDITTSQWTFAGSLFYSIIVITTIGYGHISPRTDWGKITTIFYAIIGIPLMLLCLSNIGDVMATSFRFIYWRVCCYICTRTSSRSRSRQRSTVRSHRYSSRSQPPPYRRSMKITQRQFNDTGPYTLHHTHSDPELHRLRRDCLMGLDHTNDYEYFGQRMYGNPYRDHSYQSKSQNSTITANRKYSIRNHSYQCDDDVICPEDDTIYAHIRNKSSNGRIFDRHTVERERYLGRSKQQFDSIEDLDDISRIMKRSMSVKSMRVMNNDHRCDHNIHIDTKKYTESNECNRCLVYQHQQYHPYHHQKHYRGKSMPTSTISGRSKSLDHRISLANYENIDEELIRKTPIIMNRYAINDLECKENRAKYPRNYSMPRSSHNKNSLQSSLMEQCHQYTIENLSNTHPNYTNKNKISNYRRNSLRQQTVNSDVTNLPYTDLNKISRSKRQQQQQQQQHIYTDEFGNEIIDNINGPEYIPLNEEKLINRCCRHSKNFKIEKLERLPSSTRIMSPMDFPVKAHLHSTSNYDYDENYYIDGEYNDLYSNISPKDRPVPIWLCVFLVISYILGGAALFAYWEEWSFLDSAYFCFITLTTIGFGDFVPAKGVKDESEQSIAYCSLYLLFGIALLAMSFNLVQEEFIANVKEVARRLGILKDDDDIDD